jgi:hypothetical protein
MTDTVEPHIAPVAPELLPRPVSMPPRAEFVEQMLVRTKRHGTPIRSLFVQKPRNGKEPRPGPLHKFKRSNYLDAFLWIHTLASAKEPYEATYPAIAWARSLGLDEDTGSGDEDNATAKGQWSKITRRLVDMNLITRHRTGRAVRYELLNESGDASEYVRPKKVSDGTWLTLPDAYWLQGHYLDLTFPAKVMLLIALSSKPGFTLPFERVPEWYGVSRSTAQRGFAELHAKGIITFSQDWRFDPKNPRTWSEERSYTLLGPYSADAIRAAMKDRNFPTVKPSFTDEITEALAAETQSDAVDDVTTS